MGRLLSIGLLGLAAGWTPAGAAETAPSPFRLEAPKVQRRRAREAARKLSEEEAKEYTEVPTRLLNCSVCFAEAKVPTMPPPPGTELWELTATDFDGDLCPHPVGLVNFHAEIMLCPTCGFAAYALDWIQDQADDLRAWVAQTLTPSLRDAQRSLVGMALQAMMADAEIVVGEAATGAPPGRPINREAAYRAALDKRLIEAFADQASLPDTIRCEHARAYYQRTGASRGMRVKTTILAAWAYRRAVSSSIEEPFLMYALRSVQGRARRGDLVAPPDIEAQAERYRDLLDTRITPKEAAAQTGLWLERQVAYVVLAGLYNRLGYVHWARHCLNEAAAETERAAADPDPLDDQPILTDADITLRADALRNLVDIRRRQIDYEQLYLKAAVNLLLESLDAGDFDDRPGDIPERMYLIGEFSRRVQDWPRALLWLEAARRCTGPGAKIETYAPDQIRALETFLSFNATDPTLLARQRAALPDLPDFELCLDLVEQWIAWRGEVEQALPGAAAK